MKSFFRFLSTPYGLLVHFILLVCITILLLYKPVLQFTNLDPAPVQFQVTTKGVPQVETGFALENFAEFDILKNKFLAEGIIWFLYDPKQTSLDTLGEFSFNKGMVIEKSSPIVIDQGDKKLARYHVRFSFTNPLSFRNFPVDDHRIYMELKNDAFTADTLKFISKKANFTQSVDIEEGGWTLVGSDVHAGYGKTVLKDSTFSMELLTPQVIFSLDYDRSGIHLLITILLPLLLLFFAALAVFMVRIPSIFDASNTFMGCVFALIGYLFVVETISPQVGYMMLSNYIYLSVLICTFSIAMLGWGANKFSLAWRGLIGTAVELLLIGLLFYFIVIWR